MDVFLREALTASRNKALESVHASLAPIEAGAESLRMRIILTRRIVIGRGKWGKMNIGGRKMRKEGE
jgi:hypothetical protein